MLSYELNDYIILCVSIDKAFTPTFLTCLPYFDLATYVLSGTLDIDIDDKSYSLSERQAASYSGLSNRYISSKGPCSFITILRKKGLTHYFYNPLNEYKTILEAYIKQHTSNKKPKINSDNMDFTIIKQLRNMKDLSLERLAEESGMSTSAISLIENNKRAPSLSSMSAIASVLGDTPVNLYHLAKKIETTIYTSKHNDKINKKDLKFDVYDLVINDVMFNFITTSEEEFEFGQLKNHPFCMEIQIPIEGTLTMTIEDEQYTVNKEQLMVFDGNRPHKYKISDKYKGIIIRVPKNKNSLVANNCNELEET